MGNHLEVNTLREGPEANKDLGPRANRSASIYFPNDQGIAKPSEGFSSVKWMKPVTSEEMSIPSGVAVVTDGVEPSVASRSAASRAATSAAGSASTASDSGLGSSAV